MDEIDLLQVDRNGRLGSKTPIYRTATAMAGSPQSTDIQCRRRKSGRAARGPQRLNLDQWTARKGGLSHCFGAKSQCFVSHILGCAVLPIFLDNCPTAAYHGSSSSLERTRVVERSTRAPERSTPAED